ncbi:DUF2505 domain-containing protein [Sporichthya polymorpha]|uniref:DUF2505 domain-containing protein n=1 Tax=Sporichthya polymorpha TaxID=35751 RepID=UPI00038274BC|nr:DUF2505 domain-containing protein [Sporichthya polymorpha]
MATRYTHTFTWDAPPAAVHAMVTDPAYQEQRAQAGNPISAEASVTGGADGTTISVYRLMAIDPPGFLKNFVGDKIGIQETQTWTSPTEATLLVEILKQPGDVRGTIRLAESGASTVVTVEASIAVKVPLVGGKVESYVASIVDRLLAKDEELGKTWLAGGGR